MTGRRERRRHVLSLLSLLLLFTLLGAWIVLKVSTKQEGKLGSVSVAQVKVSISQGETAPAAEPAGSEDQATATPTARPVAGRPGIVAEVLGTGDDSGALANAGAGGSRPGGSSPGPPAATATASPRSTAGRPVIGLAPPDSPPPTQAPATATQATGPGGSGGSPGATATALPTSAAPTSQPPASATAGGGGAPNTPVPATATPASETVAAITDPGVLAIPGLAAPGAYKSGGIRVTNAGTVAFHYSVSMTTTGSSAFASFLKLRIYLRAPSSPTSCQYQGGPASGDDLPALPAGATLLYYGNFATGNKVGDPTVEVAPGDRFLNIGQSEVLCMEVFFPWSAGNAYQGLAVSGALTFTAKAPE